MAHPVAVTTPRARKTTTPRDSRVSEVSKFVLHASGNLGVDGASEQAVVFRKVSRRVRQIPSGGLYEGLL